MQCFIGKNFILLIYNFIMELKDWFDEQKKN